MFTIFNEEPSGKPLGIFVGKEIYYTGGGSYPNFQIVKLHIQRINIIPLQAAGYEPPPSNQPIKSETFFTKLGLEGFLRPYEVLKIKLYPSYTIIMKTAISMPNALFQKAEQTAQYMGIPRSQLFVKALEEYITRYNGEMITQKLNEVYEKIDQNEFSRDLDIGLVSDCSKK